MSLKLVWKTGRPSCRRPNCARQRQEKQYLVTRPRNGSKKRPISFPSRSPNRTRRRPKAVAEYCWLSWLVYCLELRHIGFPIALQTVPGDALRPDRNTPPIARHLSHDPCHTLCFLWYRRLSLLPSLLSVKMAYRNPKTGLGGGASEKKLASEAHRAIGGIEWKYRQSRYSGKLRDNMQYAQAYIPAPTKSEKTMRNKRKTTGMIARIMETSLTFLLQRTKNSAQQKESNRTKGEKQRKTRKWQSKRRNKQDPDLGLVVFRLHGVLQHFVGMSMGGDKTSRYSHLVVVLAIVQCPPKGAGKMVPRENCRKVSKNFLTLFDDFWGFFALRENCRKVSKNFLTLFDDFWLFLTWPLSAGPFLQSTD